LEDIYLPYGKSDLENALFDAMASFEDMRMGQLFPGLYAWGTDKLHITINRDLSYTTDENVRIDKRGAALCGGVNMEQDNENTKYIEPRTPAKGRILSAAYGAVGWLADKILSAQKIVNSNDIIFERMLLEIANFVSERPDVSTVQLMDKGPVKDEDGTIKKRKAVKFGADGKVITDASGKPIIEEINAASVAEATATIRVEDRGLMPKFEALTKKCGWSGLEEEPKVTGRYSAYLVRDVYHLQPEGIGYVLEFNETPRADISKSFDELGILGNDLNGSMVFVLNASDLFNACEIDVIHSENFTINSGVDMRFASSDENMIVEVPAAAFVRPATAILEKVMISDCRYPREAETPAPKFDISGSGFHFEEIVVYPYNIISSWQAGQLSLRGTAWNLTAYLRDPKSFHW